MTKSYEYKTAKGSKVELTVSIKHITETPNLADHNFTTKCSRYDYKVESIKVNGKSYNGTFKNLAYDIKVGQQGNQPILVEVPKWVIDDFTADQRAEAKAKAETLITAEKEYQAHTAMMKKAMEA